MAPCWSPLSPQQPCPAHPSLTQHSLFCCELRLDMHERNHAQHFLSFQLVAHKHGAVLGSTVASVAKAWLSLLCSQGEKLSLSLGCADCFMGRFQLWPLEGTRVLEIAIHRKGGKDHGLQTGLGVLVLNVLSACANL